MGSGVPRMLTPLMWAALMSSQESANLTTRKGERREERGEERGGERGREGGERGRKRGRERGREGEREERGRERGGRKRETATLARSVYTALSHTGTHVICSRWTCRPSEHTNSIRFATEDRTRQVGRRGMGDEEGDGGGMRPHSSTWAHTQQYTSIC